VRALIFGGTGMVGRALAAEARRRGWPALALSRQQADITAPQEVAFWLRAFAPHVVFNCAALTAVDRCEEQRERAFRVHGEAVGELATAAASAGARLVHLSTDYVFDGTASRPYREGDSTAPLSVYGASKLVGEQHALESPGSLVVRTSWVFGPGGGNFVATMVRLMREGRVPLRVVDDQRGGPTFAPFLATALCDLARAGVTGVVHYRNREPVTWFGLATEIAALWDARVEVLPVSTAEQPRPARRPAFSILDVARFEEITRRRVEPWGWGLGPYLESLRRAGHAEAH
jgi:dTDP-4-dehydrorhamnose reductase